MPQWWKFIRPSINYMTYDLSLLGRWIIKSFSLAISQTWKYLKKENLLYITNFVVVCWIIRVRGWGYLNLCNSNVDTCVKLMISQLFFPCMFSGTAIWRGFYNLWPSYPPGLYTSLSKPLQGNDHSKSLKTSPIIRPKKVNA